MKTVAGNSFPEEDMSWWEALEDLKAILLGDPMFAFVDDEYKLERIEYLRKRLRGVPLHASQQT